MGVLLFVAGCPCIDPDIDHMVKYPCLVVLFLQHVLDLVVSKTGNGSIESKQVVRLLLVMPGGLVGA